MMSTRKLLDRLAANSPDDSNRVSRRFFGSVEDVRRTTVHVKGLAGDGIVRVPTFCRTCRSSESFAGILVDGRCAKCREAFGERK
jgi:hypothetical protein